MNTTDTNLLNKFYNYLQSVGFDATKTLLQLFGATLLLWVIFHIFSPSELWIILTIVCGVFLLYGIQRVEWAEEYKKDILGIEIFHSRIIKQQLRLFGIIPLGEVRIAYTEESYFKNFTPREALEITNLFFVFQKKWFGLLPLGGLKTIGIALPHK